MLQPTVTLDDDQGEKKTDKKKDLQQEERTTVTWRPAKKAGNKMFLHFIQVVKMKANTILLVFVRKGLLKAHMMSLAIDCCCQARSAPPATQQAKAITISSKVVEVEEIAAADEAVR